MWGLPYLVAYFATKEIDFVSVKVVPALVNHHE